MSRHSPQRRVIVALNHIDQAERELDALSRDMPGNKTLTKAIRLVEQAQQVVARDLTREVHLPRGASLASKIARQWLEGVDSE